MQQQYWFLEKTTVAQAQKLNLLPEEFDKIQQLLGRVPNFTELCLYSALWSEHCSYKNSILLLKTLPKTGSRVLAAAGEENAGLLDIGEGVAVCFKIESHNHPSAIEPYQGAATGVGGIHRDIFTMGARPVAALNSLRFGDPTDPATRRLLAGVVRGIGDYGNAFGVPTVAGEVFFDPAYHNNPLVNAMSVGIIEQPNPIISATAAGIGNPVYIVGNKTGRDGIHGASFASQDLAGDRDEKLPAIQIGDPFVEKLLLEASLAAGPTGGIVGMQDMGAAGIACSTAEMAARGRVGMEIYLDKVPARVEGMLPYELLLSESQERMLLVIKQGYEAEIEAIFARWELACVCIGKVIAGGQLYYYWHDQLVAEVPAESLVLGGGAPVYQRIARQDETHAAHIDSFSTGAIPLPAENEFPQIIAHLLTQPNIASKNCIATQYDSMVGAATVSGLVPFSAALVALPGFKRALAMTVDCNPRWVAADPFVGTALAVAEAARNIACTGAVPLGVTNCLNFGNPYNPHVYWQFSEAIAGMKAACEKLGFPVTGGNVSFYNQSETGPVLPTPTIGMVGLLENINDRVGLAFRPGDVLLLIGDFQVEDYAGSQYLASYHQQPLTPAPYLNLETEQKLINILPALAKQQLLRAANDVADGGLITALLESAFPHNTGLALTAPPEVMLPDAFWFGEGGGRVVVAVLPENQVMAEKMVQQAGLKCYCLGRTNETDALSVNGQHWGTISHFHQLWKNALTQLMQ